MAAPLTLNTTHQGSWDCDSCANTFACPPHQPFQGIGGEFNCSGCILPFFEAAFKYDHHWPARWGPDVLRIEDFASILEPEMLASLLWKRTAMQAEADRLAGLNPSGMEGQERGVDYQYCPRCNFPISLVDGCNHVVCRCRENFCFFCGQSAQEDSGHWDRPTGCPRWGIAHLPEAEQLPEAERNPRHYDADGNLWFSCTAWRKEIVQLTNDHVFVGIWTWNVAMQNADLELRSVMQRFVQLRYDGDPLPTTGQWLLVVNAMMAFSSAHGVTEDEWAHLLTEHAEERLRAWETRGRRASFIHPPDWDRFLSVAHYLGDSLESHMMGPRPLGEIDPPAHGDEIFANNLLLHQPIGGVFNLSIGESRHAAANWILNRTRADTADWSGPENYAILVGGPGGTAESHLLGAEIMTTLHGRSGRTRLWLPHVQRAVTFFGSRTSEVIVHVSEEEFDVDDRRFHSLIAIGGDSHSLQEQDNIFRDWFFRLFTDPEDILNDVRDVYARVEGQFDERPSRLYIRDYRVQDSDDQKYGENDDQASSDEDVEMSDAGEEG